MSSRTIPFPELEQVLNGQSQFDNNDLVGIPPSTEALQAVETPFLQ
ncbi:unnamed protein product, partial [Didymodactylos carnosus]